MLKKPVTNARDVLPKGLLTKLQRRCSGLVYIPAPQTTAQINMARVRSLHIRGHEPARIAGIVGLSTRHVCDIIKRFEDGGKIASRQDYEVYESVPRELVELVKKHASGLVYVPPKTSQADRRRARVKRMLDKDLRVSEIAKRTGISERRVWQIKKADLEAAKSGSTAGKIHVKANKEKPHDPFAVGPATEPGYVPPKLCSICGARAGSGEEDCDVCNYQAKARRNADGGDIVISRIPFAVIDRQF